MRTRRGSSLWPTTLSGASMVNQYQPGDIVTSSLTRESDFIGVVRGVDPKINKVWVAWAGGVVGQHDPDEIHFEPYQSALVRSRMASRRPFFAADPATDPQFVGDPAAHGLDKPIGGGFSIMQNLVKDQRQEMHEQSKGGQPKMAAADGRPKFAFEVTKKEWEAALLSDEKLLAKMKQDLNSMERGGSVANLTPENAKMVIRGLEQIIGNKKHLLSKFASMKTRRAARRPVSIVVELGGQQGHYIIDNGYRAVSPGELPEMIAKAFKARIQRSMAGMFGPEFQGVEIELPTTQMIQELRDELLQSRSGKATIVLDLNTDRYTFKRAALYSRRAMYWSSPERIYRLTKREIVDSSALCPKCRKEMELEPYTKTDRMYRCQLCGFKIPRSSVIVASLKSRRATNHLTNSQQFD